MVRIGDRIKVGKDKGIITNINELKNDNRYVIVYKTGNKYKAFREGDKRFKVI